MRIAITIVAMMWFGISIAQTNETYNSLQDALEAKAQGVTVVHLDLTKNKLNSVPKEILEFQELQTLILDKNKLDLSLIHI